MKESLIKFETAVLAKEVGFNWDVLYATDYNGDFIPFALEGGYWNWNELITHYSIPTQSLLQKWLREVHHIDVYIMPNFYHASPKLGYIYSIDCFDKNNVHDGKIWDADQIEILGDSKGFNTYEECLEKGLQECLKLIKQ